ncbi:MAG: sugar phosphate nucleotidyltransferase [Halobacterium sp.]
MSRHEPTDTITDAVVLAGGEGRRLRPLTEHRPKPMLPAANRPILERVFDALVASGMTTLHVVVGYRHERVQDHFGTTYRGVPVRYYRQSKQLGSGHALQQAADGVAAPFLAVNGDQLTEPRMVGDVVDAHEANGACATLGVVESEAASRYGSVTLDGTSVTTIVEREERSGSQLLNAGVYGFDEAIFDDAARTEFDGGVLDLPDVLSTLIDGRRPVEGVRTEGYWLDATYPWDLLTVARRLLSAEGVDGSGTDGDADAADGGVAADARVHETAVVRPPTVVSADCEVGPGAVVGPYTALGPNVTVDANAVVSESVLGEDTRVGPNSTVERTVTGQGVRLGPECVVPAGRTDVRIGDEIHADQRLGAVIADRVRVVGDGSFAPGSLVGPNATVGLGARVDGTVDGGAEVVR